MNKPDENKTKSFKRVLRRIPGLILLVVISILIGFGIYNFNARDILGNRMPMPFGYGAAVVMSGSMEPALMTGDLVIVKEYGKDEEASELREGDIIVYTSESGSSLVIHRIAGFMDEGGIHRIITKGDANNTEDAPLTADRVIGTYVLRIPKAGDVMLALKNPVCIIGMIVMAVLLLELGIVSDKKKEQEELQRIKDEIRLLKEQELAAQFDEYTGQEKKAVNNGEPERESAAQPVEPDEQVKETATGEEINRKNKV
ncbi:MAG: signal peptidase I [Eubacteriales bacterium]|nr:signal peptidase I [Eubacteriales bacterium]